MLWYSDQIDTLTIVCFTDKQHFIYIHLKEKPRSIHFPIEIIFIPVPCYLFIITLIDVALLYNLALSM